MPRRVDPDRRAGQAPIAQPELMFPGRRVQRDPRLHGRRRRHPQPHAALQRAIGCQALGVELVHAVFQRRHRAVAERRNRRGQFQHGPVPVLTALLGEQARDLQLDPRPGGQVGARVRRRLGGA